LIDSILTLINVNYNTFFKINSLQLTLIYGYNIDEVIYLANPRLKNRVQFTTSTTPDLLRDFQKLSEDTRINMSRLMDEAIDDLLKKYEDKK
jgi:hypothetical protein